MNPIEFTAANPQPGVTLAADSTSGLICGGVSVPAKGLNYGITYELNSLDDAKAKGLSTAYDDANSVLVYNHISEFFRLAGGKKARLFFMVVPQATPQSNMWLLPEFARKLLIDAKGKVQQIATAYNPVAYTPTIVNGLPIDVTAAIGEAQGLADWARAQAMPVHAFVEGKAWSGNASSSADLRALEISAGVISSCPKVTLVIGQDWTQADKVAIFNKYAAVGTALGSCANANVHENFGWAIYDISSAATPKAFLVPSLSNHQTIFDAAAQLDTLDAKGYVFATTYPQYPGVYWNNDHSCVAVVVNLEDGSINEHCVHYSRVGNKVDRVLYAALLPFAKSPQLADPATGKISSLSIATIEGAAKNALDARMGNLNQFSGRNVAINPNSDVLIAKELNIAADIVPVGSTDKIKISRTLNTTI